LQISTRSQAEGPNSDFAQTASEPSSIIVAGGGLGIPFRLAAILLPMKLRLFLLCLLGFACRSNQPAPAQKLPPLTSGPMNLQVMNSSEMPPVVLAPPEPAPPDAVWRSLESAGGDLDFGNAVLDFSPRSAHWRFSLSSDHLAAAFRIPNRDQSYLQISLWMGDHNADGKVILRPVVVHFQRKGGAGCVQEFDNGLWPDGSPRPFRIMINGTFINYQARIEDLGPSATTRPTTREVLP
jgi:hypothetical protein